MSITDLELSSIQLHNGLDMLQTIQEAMAEHPDRQTSYADALYSVYHYLKLTECRLLEAMEEVYHELRVRPKNKSAPPDVSSIRQGGKPS